MRLKSKATIKFRSVPAIFALVAIASTTFMLPSWSDEGNSENSNPTFSIKSLLSPGDSGNSSFRVAVTLRDGLRLKVLTKSFATRKAADDFVGEAANDTSVEAVALDLQRKALGVTTPVNDPLFSQQWALTALRAVDDWRVTTGAGIKVAVVDTGVDASHPDLQGKVLNGTDFVGDDYTTSSGGTGKVDPYGHGTHVSGIITMNANNSKGGVGLAPDVQILPVRVLDANGSGYDSDIARGIIWATDQGAQIINLSLGGPGTSTVLNNAVKYAADRGVAVIAAAGNEGDVGNPTSYPGASPGAIAVAAVARNFIAPKWSNRGSYVTFAAPGVDILSTTNGAYESWSGTSMATPYIAAAYALLESYKPTLTVAQETAALKVGAFRPISSGTRDDTYGFGIPNIVAALNANGASISTPTPSFTINGPSASTYGANQTISIQLTPPTALFGGYANISLKPNGYNSKTIANRVIFDATGLATLTTAMNIGGQISANIYNVAGTLVQTLTGPYLNLTINSLVNIPNSAARPTGSVTIGTNSVLSGTQVQLQQGNAAGNSWTTMATTTISTKGNANFSNVTFTQFGQRRVIIAAKPELAIAQQVYTVIPR